MDKPLVSTITSEYITESEALGSGASYGEIDDRNSSFFKEVDDFSISLSDAADYVEWAVSYVDGYANTKAELDEALSNGDYLDELLEYENRILEYHNQKYSTNETILEDWVVDNLSAVECEELTAPLLNKVYFNDHKNVVLSFFNEFRADRQNSLVYHDIKNYLQPLKQGIARIISDLAENSFGEGSEARAAFDTHVDEYVVLKAAEVDDAVDLAAKITLAQSLKDELVSATTNAANINNTLILNIPVAQSRSDELSLKIADANTKIADATAILSDLSSAISNADALSTTLEVDIQTYLDSLLISDFEGALV